VHITWSAVWVVIEVKDVDLIRENGAVRFSRGNVIFNGPARKACTFLRKHNLPVPRHDIKEVSLGDDAGVVRVGDHGVAVAARWGRAAAGDCGKALAFMGDVSAGGRSLAYTDFGSASVGGDGIAVAFDSGTAKARDKGIAIVGEWGGSVQAGVGGVLVMKHFNPGTGAAQWRVAVVGEGGILPDTPYTLDPNGCFVRDQGSRRRKGGRVR
jgi:hypothetical protein